MLTSGEEAYAAYVTAVEQREVPEATVTAMWQRLLPHEQRAWEEVALLVALRQAYGHTLPVRQRRAAVCAVCSALLEAGAWYCQRHPEAQIMVMLEEEKNSDATN